MFENKTGEAAKVIEGVIQNYFQGYLMAEPETLLKAFTESARLFATDKGSLEKTEMSEWITNLNERSAKGDRREAMVQIEGIDVSGDAAIAKTALTFKEFKFTDYLSLLLIEGHWKIVNKIYTVQKFTS